MRTSCKKVIFFVNCLLLSSLLGLATGCGSKEGTVSGKVYYQGKTLNSGVVNFVPEGKGGSFSSQIKPDGSYTIFKVPPGAAKISVVTTSAGPPDMRGKMPPGAASRAAKGMEEQKKKLTQGKTEGMEGAVDPSQVVQVPEKFSDPEKSGLKVDVTGGKQNFDIKIE